MMRGWQELAVRVARAARMRRGRPHVAVAAFVGLLACLTPALPAAASGPSVAARAAAGGTAGYAALPAPLVGTAVERLRSSTPPYTATLRVPEIVWPGHDAAALHADAQIDAWVAAQVRAFSSGVTQDLSHSRGMPASLPPSNLSLTFTVGVLDAAVASFRFTLEPYYRGAANPAQEPAGLTFDMASGHELTMAALFKPGSAQWVLLARQSLAGLKAFRPAGAHCYVGPGGPPAKAASFEAWNLSPAGLVLSFPAGLYTAAYCGPPAITVPFRALQALAALGGLLRT